MNAELEGTALDAEVARCLGQAPYFGRSNVVPPNIPSVECWRDGNGWPIDRFSSDWSVAGPIIEREQISLIRQSVDWCADMRGVECQFAATPLVAAMRAFVRSKTPNVEVEAPNTAPRC